MPVTRGRSPFFERVKAGLEDGLRHARGEIELVTYVVSRPDPAPLVAPTEVTALRERLRLTQIAFAQLMNVPVAFVRAWETGRRKPTGAAARLIQVYSARPDVVELVANGKNGTPAKPARSRS